MQYGVTRRDTTNQERRKEECDLNGNNTKYVYNQIRTTKTRMLPQ